MPVIDADTHVDESESTWQALEGAMARYTPTTMTPPEEAIEHAKSRPSPEPFLAGGGSPAGSRGP